MVIDSMLGAKTATRFAAPPWTESSELWLAADAQLSSDHLARDIREAMTHLDLTPLYLTYGRRGKAPHPPDLMLAMVLFELRRGQRKPSQWYRDTQENIALWWLGFGIRPSRSSWYEFRDRTAACLDTFNQALLHRAVDHDLTTAQRGALDGSAVAANASWRRLLNTEQLVNRVEQLGAVAQDEAAGEETGPLPGWMGTTPTGCRRQQERLGQVQDQMVARQAANAKQPSAQRREPDKIVISPGDPEAALGLDKDHVFRPLYTVQTIRDVESPLILAYEVFAQASDAATLLPMLGRLHHLTGRVLPDLLVDCGYVTGLDLADCRQQGVTLYGPWKENDWSSAKPPKRFSKDRFIWHAERDAYECPAGQMLERVSSHTRVGRGGREVREWTYRSDASTCQACPLRSQCTTSQKSGRSVQRSEHDDLIAAHRAWMETAPAKSVYRLRGQTIEIVFADVKEHRGLRRFSGHGRARVRAEFALDVLLHNLLVVHRALSPTTGLEDINEATEDWAA